MSRGGLGAGWTRGGKEGSYITQARFEAGWTLAHNFTRIQAQTQAGRTGSPSHC